MELADRAVGFLLSLISILIHLLYFLGYHFAICRVITLSTSIFCHKNGVALLCLLCMLVGFVVLKSKKKKS